MNGRSCSLPDCDRKHFGHGYCNTHYVRWRKHGNPNLGGLDRANVELEFWQRVAITANPEKCWIWTATSRHHFGYGQMKIKGKTYSAHRLAWVFTNGPIPPKMVIRHECDNAPCCNPNHLRIGTQLDNVADRQLRGRTTKGVNVNTNKLSESDVLVIRERRANGERCVDLAKEFNTVATNISAITLRQNWKHL